MSTDLSLLIRTGKILRVCQSCCRVCSFLYIGRGLCSSASASGLFEAANDQCLARPTCCCCHQLGWACPHCPHARGKQGPLALAISWFRGTLLWIGITAQPGWRIPKNSLPNVHQSGLTAWAALPVYLCSLVCHFSEDIH